MRFAITLFAAALLTAGYFALQDAPPASRGAVAAVEHAVGWPQGRTTWAVEWQVETEATVGAAVTAGAEVQATVELLAHAESTWAARFVSFETLEFTVQANVQAPPTDALLGPTLYVRLDAVGAPVEWWASPDAPQGFAHLMTGCLRRLQVLAPGVDRERSPLGEVAVAVNRVGDSVRRTRQTYLNLDGAPDAADVPVTSEHVAWLDDLGVTRIVDAEVVEAEGYRAEVEFRAERVETQPVATSAASSRRVAHRPGRPSEAGQRALWTQQAGHLTAARLMADLRRLSASGARPDSEWLWRAAGRLLLDPELAAELTALVVAGELAPQGQALVFDLLAGVGHAEAQAAMVDALNHPALNRDVAVRRGLLQRLGLLQRPSESTVEYARTLLDTDEPDDRRAGAMTLGAVASRLGDSTTAEDIGEQLVGALRGAEQIEDRRALLAAVGNAGLSSLEGEVLAYVDDDSDRVRRAAVYALRKYDTAEARAALLDAIGGDEAIVQQAALSALDARSVTPSEARRLAAATAERQVAKGSRAQVLNAASKGIRDADDAQVEAWRDVLEAIVATTEDDPRIAAQARKILRRLDARSEG